MNIRARSMITSMPLAVYAGLAAQPLSAQYSSMQPVVAQGEPARTTLAGVADQSGPVITVTGSRIFRAPNETAPSPIELVSIDDIYRTGVVDATEALRELPALANSGTLADSLQNGAGAIGVASLNLRGLGSARTLVLVNERRHVSSIAGSQIVDVATIPPALIERVEVLTGGASAVYGADAVTGVVNYVLRDEFEGFALNAQSGLSEKGDGFTASVDFTAGFNAADERGNITFALGYAKIDQLLQADRSFYANNGQFNTNATYPSPLRRFQKGDITEATPAFARFFSAANGLLPFGFAIPQPGSPAYAAIFAGATPTAAEQALIERAGNAPALAFMSDPRFAISSNAGLIFRNDFDFFKADINANGINDCGESYIGLTGLGGGGCYVSNADGTVRIFEDGFIAGPNNQFGGDGAVERANTASLVPGNERVFLNMLGHYNITDSAEAFVDLKYVRSDTRSQDPNDAFFDSLYVAPDNPFIPTALQADADEAGGLRVSRDFLDLGAGRSLATRDTYRLVAGLRGEFGDGAQFSWQGAVNYGKTDTRLRAYDAVLYDRLFASIDAVDEGAFLTGSPNGNIVCRSQLDPAARHPGSEFEPVIEPGFFTFSPAGGQCVPASLFDGEQSVSAAAANFITTATTNRAAIDQLVASASLAGDTGSVFALPGGPARFVIGAEYRRETSQFDYDDLRLGIAPITTPDIAAGQFIGDVSGNQSLVFDAQTQVFDTDGEFDVAEVYGELNLPILSGQPFFHTLELGGAARYSRYSTVGGTFTWSVNAIWAPIADIRLRGTYARAVRAPNIGELFTPAQGFTFRPSDPCDIAQIAVLAPADAARRQANCVADFQAVAGGASLTGTVFDAAGNYIYADPLTARFAGTIGGNRNLTEETATTYTFGAVIAPRLVPSLVLSADYYNIRIDDAIAAVSAQDIVNTCYAATQFPNQFCGRFSRNADPANPAFLGFDFLALTQLNYGRIATAGIDATFAYSFDIGEVGFRSSASVNWVDHIDRFFDPTDPTLNNPGLREEQRPEWAGLGSLSARYGPVTLGYRLQYIGSTALSGVEIETAAAQVGPAGFADDYFIHDLSATFDVNEDFSIHGGVNNVSGEKPYPTNFSYPVSPYGRYFFLGVSLKERDLGI